MQAVILAGGLATRLRPLTAEIPKSLIQVRDKPFFEYQLDFLKKGGVEDIVLCVGYLGEQIENYLVDGKRLGMNITYSEEVEQLLGTAGALRQAKSLLDDHFFVINGDTYLPIDYKRVERCFLTRRKKGLMVVYDGRENVGISNNVGLNDNLMVVKHSKRNSNASLKYVDVGVSVFRREAVDDITGQYPISLEIGLYPSLIEQGELAGYVTGQRFYDIGTPEQLKTFEKYLRKELR